MIVTVYHLNAQIKGGGSQSEAARSPTQYLAGSVRPRPDTVLSGNALQLLSLSLLDSSHDTGRSQTESGKCGKMRIIVG